LTILENALRSANGVIAVAVILTCCISALLWQRWRDDKSTFARTAMWQWIGISLLLLIGVVALFIFGNTWLATNIAALRYVILAFILIITMILRPQGLMGRKEWGWHSIPFLNKRIA